MLQTPVPGTRLVKNLSLRWCFCLFRISCFEFVSDFVLRDSDLLGGRLFINSETPRYLTTA